MFNKMNLYPEALTTNSRVKNDPVFIIVVNEVIPCAFNNVHIESNQYSMQNETILFSRLLIYKLCYVLRSWDLMFSKNKDLYLLFYVGTILLTINSYAKLANLLVSVLLRILPPAYSCK